MAISPMAELSPGGVKINAAKFMAALITCETFAEYCADAITPLELDNISAMVWMQTARCPRHPFDRAAQGAHLYMLKKSMKLRVRWVPSADNACADTVSRQTFSRSREGHDIGGYRLRKIAPKICNVRRFL